MKVRFYFFAKRVRGFSCLLMVGIGLTVNAQSYNWSTNENWGVFKWGGMAFANNRWNNIVGSMYLDTSSIGQYGKNVHYWTQHYEYNNCCSAPWVSLGESGVNEVAADNGFLPIKLKDIQTLRGYWKFKVPMPLNPGWGGNGSPYHQYHVYYQLYVGTGTSLIPASRGAGDGAFVMFDSYFYRQNDNFGTEATIGGTRYDQKPASNSGYGPFFIAVRFDLQPDANGIVEVRDVDIKALIDHAVTNGWWNGEHYLIHISNAFEVMNLTDGKKLETLDLAYLVQSKGSFLKTIPSWKTNIWNQAPTGTASAFRVSTKAPSVPRLHVTLRNGRPVVQVGADKNEFFSVAGKSITGPSQKPGKPGK